jgi:hypothetical protein
MLFCFDVNACVLTFFAVFAGKSGRFTIAHPLVVLPLLYANTAIFARVGTAVIGTFKVMKYF